MRRIASPQAFGRGETAPANSPILSRRRLLCAALLLLSALDVAAGDIQRVSVSGAGPPSAGGQTVYSSTSANGRYVAFSSFAENLVDADTNGVADVFLRDRLAGVTTRVSVTAGGGQVVGGGSFDPVLSADGRFVAFRTAAAGLVPDDTNALSDVFVCDRQSGQTTRVSVATGGGQAVGGGSYDPAISADGRFVAFRSMATNLVGGDTNGASDIYVHDRLTGLTTRVSVATGGREAASGSFAPSISADGRLVAFDSVASNLVSDDTNEVADVFVHDRATGVTARVNAGVDGTEAAGGASLYPALSADGSVVAFESSATNLVEGDTNGSIDVFLVDLASRVVVRVSRPNGGGEAAGDSGAPSVNATGRYVTFASDAANLVGGDANAVGDVFVFDRQASTVARISTGIGAEADGPSAFPASSAYGGVIVFESLAANLDASDTNRSMDVFAAVLFADVTDSDADGMHDADETFFGLDPQVADAGLDADADGVTNAAEIAAGTHPTGYIKRYLAEGATGSFFTTTLALTNPGQADAAVVLEYFRSDGTMIPQRLVVAPHSRATVNVGLLAGLEAEAFSTVMESNRLVVLDRSMTWDVTGYGRHAETAQPELSTTWYLAEGATHSGFALFYLLQNPQTTPTDVTVTYLRPSPLAPIVKSYELTPHSRTNIWVNIEDPRLEAVDVSAEIVASRPILVERAMYRTTGRLFEAGHGSAGVTAPALDWFLAEGATGPYFDLFVLLANPDARDASVRVSYLLPDGTTLTKPYQVPARSRANIWVDFEDARLANTAVSTTVTVTNGVPIIVERAMWWPGDASTWAEAHNAAGVTSTGVAWVTSAGEDGGAGDAETYILVANTASVPATVKVTLFFENAATVSRTFDVASHSRFNVAPRVHFPEAAGKRFGALIESVGDGEAPIVVEQAVYSSTPTQFWAAGSDAVGTKIR